MTIIENKYRVEKQKDKLDESRLVGDRWQEEKMTQELLVIFDFSWHVKLISV